MFETFRLKMLNREAASPKNMPDKIIKSMDIQKGNFIADLGSGGGYFTSIFSKEVGMDGKIFAVDTNKKALEFIENMSKKNDIINIETVLANENGLILPETVDMFFLRNVFHHLPSQEEYFKNIKQFLKDEGKIVIIDYKKKAGFIGIFGHYTPEEVLIDKMDKAGFYMDKKFDFLHDQSFVLFKKK